VSLKEFTPRWVRLTGGQPVSDPDAQIELSQRVLLFGFVKNWFGEPFLLIARNSERDPRGNVKLEIVRSGFCEL
jgi:hypothetical protein